MWLVLLMPLLIVLIMNKFLCYLCKLVALGCLQNEIYGTVVKDNGMRTRHIVKMQTEMGNICKFIKRFCCSLWVKAVLTCIIFTMKWACPIHRNNTMSGTSINISIFGPIDLATAAVAIPNVPFIDKYDQHSCISYIINLYSILIERLRQI